MIVSARSYIIFSVFSILLIACQSRPEPVKATPRFHDQPERYVTNELQYADTTLPELRDLISRLDSFYRVQVHHGFNGSVLIGREGKILYERYFGLARKETNLHLGPFISSQLASTSKTFTGAAILYLHQHNYLNIQDPVQQYLPSFPYRGITIKMLLDHRSGLPDYQKWGKAYVPHPTAPMTNAQMLSIFARFRPKLLSKPDTRFDYCNSNFALLANIIEKVTEMKYEDFLRRYLLEPLGMQHTFVYHTPSPLPANATQTYRANWHPWPLSFADGVVGDKNIYSTVRDMYRWDQSFYNHRLLNESTLELAYQPCSFERPGIKNYGLGWRMLCYPSGNQVIYHNGWWHGNNTVFYRFIKENMTFIILGNKYNNGIYKQPKVLYSLIKNVPVGEGFDAED